MKIKLNSISIIPTENGHVLMINTEDGKSFEISDYLWMKVEESLEEE